MANGIVTGRGSLWALVGLLTTGLCLIGCSGTSMEWNWGKKKPEAETPAIQPESQPGAEQPAYPPKGLIDENGYAYAFKTYGKALNAGQKKQLAEMFEAMRESFTLLMADQKDSVKLPNTPPDVGVNVWAQPVGQPTPAKTADPDVQVLIFKATDAHPLTVTVSLYSGKHAGMYYYLQGTKVVDLATWLDSQTK